MTISFFFSRAASFCSSRSFNFFVFSFSAMSESSMSSSSSESALVASRFPSCSSFLSGFFSFFSLLSKFSFLLVPSFFFFSEADFFSFFSFFEPDFFSLLPFSPFSTRAGGGVLGVDSC